MSTRVLFRHVSVKVDTLRVLSISIYALHTCKFIHCVCVCVRVCACTPGQTERQRERERETFAKKAARGGDVVFLFLFGCYGLLWAYLSCVHQRKGWAAPPSTRMQTLIAKPAPKAQIQIKTGTLDPDPEVSCSSSRGFETAGHSGKQHIYSGCLAVTMFYQNVQIRCLEHGLGLA